MTTTLSTTNTNPILTSTAPALAAQTGPQISTNIPSHDVHPTALGHDRTTKPLTAPHTYHPRASPADVLTARRLEIIYQQRRFLDKLCEAAVRKILYQLREAVTSLTVTQRNSGENVRMYLFEEHDYDRTDRIGTDTGVHQTKTSLYTFFSPTVIADNDLKKPLLR